MEVEIIGNESSSGMLDLTSEGDKGVLDLTGTTEAPASEETKEDEAALDLTDGKDASEEQEAGTETEETEAEETEESDEPELYFGDTRVAVEVPEEISAALKEAGIDETELLSQLFAKDGDFSLDEATIEKLNDKFGKTLVNGYLTMYKGINEQANLSAAATKASEEAAQAARNTEYAEAVGGEEGLVAMESYILETLNESQLSAYNAVMESDNHEAQMLVISQVKSQMELSDKLANGDKPQPLIGDKATSSNEAASPLDKGYVTKQEYQAIMESDKYWEDSSYAAQVDAARKAGLSKQV